MNNKAKKIIETDRKIKKYTKLKEYIESLKKKKLKERKQTKS